MGDDISALRPGTPEATGTGEGQPGRRIPASGFGWAVIAAVLTVLVLAPTLAYPYGRDQAVFAFVGRVIAEGGMPYRDAWDLKPPGIYLAYAALARLLPSPPAAMFGLRVMDLALSAATGVLLALCARRFWKPEVGYAAAAWYAALYLQGGYWSLAQAEAWANPLVLGAGLLLLPSGPAAPLAERGRSAAWALSGALTGSALLLKFTAVLPLLPFLILALYRRDPNRILRCTVFAGGVMAPVLGAAIWLIAGNALRDYADIQQHFVAAYTRLTASGPAQHVGRAGYHTGVWLLSTWLPALLAYGILIIRKRRGGPGLMLAAGTLAGGLLAVWVQDKYFGYHWQTALPGMALLAGLGGSALVSRLGLCGRRAAAAGAALAIVWGLGANWSSYRDAARLARGRITSEQWLARFGRPGLGDNSFLADTWVAEAVARKTSPGERILVWGFEPTVYLFSDRRPPTRFFFNVPVTAQFTPNRWRREFLSDLAESPPALFIVTRNDAIPWASGLTSDSATQLQEWSELHRWLRSNYERDEQIEDFTIYRRRPKSSGGNGARQMTSPSREQGAKSLTAQSQGPVEVIEGKERVR